MKTQTVVILWVCVAFGFLSLCVCGLVASYLGSIHSGTHVDVVYSKPNEATKTLYDLRIGGHGTLFVASQQMKDECLKEG